MWSWESSAEIVKLVCMNQKGRVAYLQILIGYYLGFRAESMLRPSSSNSDIDINSRTFGSNVSGVSWRLYAVSKEPTEKKRGEIFRSVYVLSPKTKIFRELTGLSLGSSALEQTQSP